LSDEYEYIMHEPITAEELANMRHEEIVKEVSFCTCCSPMEISSIVLKAKKKSKLKPGGKKAKRRKSFCARS